MAVLVVVGGSKARKALAERQIRSLAARGFTVVLDGARFSLAAGPFDSMDALLGHLLEHGWRVGDQPRCVQCGGETSSLCDPCRHDPVAARRRHPSSLRGPL